MTFDIKDLVFSGEPVKLWLGEEDLSELESAVDSKVSDACIREVTIEDLP